MKKLVVTLGIIISLSILTLGLYGFYVNKTDNINLDNKNEVNNNLSTNDLINSINNIKNAKSLTTKVTVATNKEDENVESTIKINFDTKEDELLMSMNGIEVMHTYSVLENNILTSYAKTPLLGNNEWIKSSADASTTSTTFGELDIILENINKFSANENNFTAILDKDIAKKLGNSDIENSEDDDIFGDVIVLIKLDEAKNISTLVFNLSNSIKSGDEVYTKYIMTYEYSDINSTVVTVPDDVKNSAKELEL